NDTYPTAMHVAGVLAVTETLIPAVQKLKATLAEKSEKFDDIIKIGRTHLQDATPLTLGQEISGWKHMLEKSERMISESVNYMRELAIGGTAVGTGINADPKFGGYVAEFIAEAVGSEFTSAENNSTL